MGDRKGKSREGKGRRILTDDEIIELYWERNERAIKETDVKYGTYLYTIAYNIVHDHMDCEECLDDTYLGTWNSIPPTRPTLFQVFLSRIMRNTALKRYRRNSAAKRIPSEMTVSLEELEGCIVIPDDREHDEALKALVAVLGSFLDTLSAREEFIFVCRYYYCDRPSDIAGMLRLSERTVWRELEDMRVRLKKMTEEAMDRG